MRRSMLLWITVMTGCTASDGADAEVKGVAWREPTSLAGGCHGGKPDRGGVGFRATHREGAFVLEVEDDPWMDDEPPVITTYALTAEQWNELVETARAHDLWSWRPISRAHADCQTCRVSIDDHVASHCGQLEGPDRGAELRRRLEALAVAGGWTR